MDLVFSGIHVLGDEAAVDAVGACGTGAGGGGGGGICRPGIFPGDLPKPGGARPSDTPPGAWTVLCLHAVDGCSSSALTDRTILPSMHLAPEIGEIGDWTGGTNSAFASSSCCPAHCSESPRHSWSSPSGSCPNNSHPSSPS